jgi:hypothetical protein
VTIKRRRDDFKPAVREQLARRAAYTCSNPSCRRHTLLPTSTDTSSSNYVGVAAHISAASPGGPRYEPSLTQAQRESIENAIHLCAYCATLIDKNNGIDYPKEQLLLWKSAHEAYIRDQSFPLTINNQFAALEEIDTWLNSVSACLEEIEVLRETSPKDNHDGLLVINTGQVNRILEQLVRIDWKGFIAITRVADLFGRQRVADLFGRQKVYSNKKQKEDHNALIHDVGVIWVCLTSIRDTLATRNVLPGVQPYHSHVVAAKRTISEIRRQLDHTISM